MSRAWKERNLVKNSHQVTLFCRKYKLKLDHLNYGYQMRIEGLLDVYPVNRRWHDLGTGERGDWYTTEDLRQLLIDRIPAAPMVEGPIVTEHKRPWWAFWRRG